MQTVKMSEMGEKLYEVLKDYNTEVTEATKEAVTEVADGVMRTIKNHITWNDTKYSKAFSLKTIYDNERGKYVIWHVGEYGGEKMWSLTHLLELGHLTRNGTTRTRKYPHVQYGQEYAYNNLAKEIKEKIQNVRT